jgi:hypothetical protein
MENNKMGFLSGRPDGEDQFEAWLKTASNGRKISSRERTKYFVKWANIQDEKFINASSLDRLMLEYHVARERYAQAHTSAKWKMVQGTPFERFVEEMPLKLERAIRTKNAELCHRARLTMLKSAGLIEYPF